MADKTTPIPRGGDASAASPDLSDYPVREYVASMAAELAVMAREDGDWLLAQTLDIAVQLARRPG